MKDTDGSESVTAMFINNVPKNFLVYSGAPGSQTLATKGVQVGTIDLDDGNGTVEMYKWSVDISGGVPKVWIKAPAQWSNLTPVDLELITTVKDGLTYGTATTAFQITASAVVDGFASLTQTNTFQLTSADTPIRLSTNTIDIDGSETGILTLKGLGVGATFKQDGTPIASTYVAGMDTYTIENIDLSVTKLNQLTLEQPNLINKKERDV